MRPVQYQLTIVFADVDKDGDVGALSQPVQLTISPQEWKTEWRTKKSDEVVANVVAQLAAAVDGPGTGVSDAS